MLLGCWSRLADTRRHSAQAFASSRLEPSQADASLRRLPETGCALSKGCGSHQTLRAAQHSTAEAACIRLAAQPPHPRPYWLVGVKVELLGTEKPSFLSAHNLFIVFAC